MFIILGKKDPGFLLVADKTCCSAQEVPSLDCDRHVGHECVDLFPILFRIRKCLFHDLLIRVDLDRDAVRVLEDLVPILIEDLLDRLMIRSLGNGGDNISFMVENGKPCSHSVLNLFHILCLNFMAFQLLDHIITHRVVVHSADERRL